MPVNKGTVTLGGETFAIEALGLDALEEFSELLEAYSTAMSDASYMFGRGKTIRAVRPLIALAIKEDDRERFGSCRPTVDELWVAHEDILRICGYAALGERMAAEAQKLLQAQSTGTA